MVVTGVQRYTEFFLFYLPLMVRYVVILQLNETDEDINAYVFRLNTLIERHRIHHYHLRSNLSILLDVCARMFKFASRIYIIKNQQ